MIPVTRVSTFEGDIFIADGFVEDGNPEYPNGYYRTMWATERGGLDVARDLIFEPDHDPILSDHDRRLARVRAATADACGWISLNMESGRYAN